MSSWRRRTYMTSATHRSWRSWGSIRWTVLGISEDSEYERLAGLVAHHTQGRHEARLRGLQEALAEFDDEDSLVSAALAYCDLTTGPSGQRMTPGQRLLDVEARYSEDSPVANGLRAAWPELMVAIRQVEALRMQPAGSAGAQPK